MSWKCLRVSPHPWFHKPKNHSEHRDVLTYCQNIGQYQWVTRTTAYNNELFSVITELQNISLFLNGPCVDWRVYTAEIRFLYYSDITTYKKWQDYNSSWVKRLILLPQNENLSVWKPLPTDVRQRRLRRCGETRLRAESEIKCKSWRRTATGQCQRVSGISGCDSLRNGMAPYHWSALECRSHAYIRPALHAQSN